MDFQQAYFDFCLIILVLSCILNGTLVHIVTKRKDRVGFYRNFTYAFVCVDVLYSLAFSVTQPYWYADLGIISFYSIAPWNDNYALIRITMQLWFAVFVALIFCITCSFAYRYGLLCSSFIVSLFERRGRLVITALVFTSVCALWLYDCNCLLFQDSEEVRLRMQEHFHAEISSDYLHGYMLVVDLTNEGTRAQKTVAAVIAIVVMESQMIVFIYCGWRIHKTIKTGKMSYKLKRLHGKALQMLIAQTLNPLVFFFIPSTFNVVGVFVDVDYGDFSKVIALSLGLFPIVNPIIVIIFTEDYKRYLLGGPTSTIRLTQTVHKSDVDH